MATAILYHLHHLELRDWYVATGQWCRSIKFLPMHRPTQSRAGLSCQSISSHLFFFFLASNNLTKLIRKIHLNIHHDKNSLKWQKTTLGSLFEVYFEFFSTAKVQSQITEEEEIMTSTTRGGIKMYWLHYWGALRSCYTVCVSNIF